MQSLKYDIAVQKFSELREKIEIPKFQRGLVWGTEKKKEFIKTLKSGLPIGVLLLYKKDEKYLVVDGLQRFTTMLDYSRDYFKYIEKSEITDEELMSVLYGSEIARNVFENYKDSVKRTQLDQMREIVAKKVVDGKGKPSIQISQEIAEALCAEISVLPKQDMWGLLMPVNAIVERIRDQAAIDDVTIPLIIFKGKEDELTDIFQKLNQEGVKLSKYDVYAAAWINDYVEVKNDPTFIDYIINKYEAARRESKLDIAAYDPDEMKQSGRLTVYEYAFAVGKAMMAKCQKLFPKANDTKVDSIGFLILAELLGLNYQDMGKLADRIKVFKTLDFKKLKDAIIESCQLVENALVPYIDSPAKSKNGKRASLVCHSELQIASYIIVMFRLKYELTTEVGLSVKAKHKELARVKENLYKHYLYDIIRGFWAGSGDSKLEEIIADPLTSRYTGDVNKADFQQQLLNWLDDANKKQSLVNVSAETKLFLNYMLRTSKVYNEKCDYDVEHCVPKVVLEKFYVKKGIQVPISSVCNLVYIPASDNRSKGDQTYYQRQAENPGNYVLNEEQLVALGYPMRQELEFVNSVETLAEENYFAFLKNRRNILLNAFIAALYT